MVLRSPALPLLGTAALWFGYAVFRLGWGGEPPAPRAEETAALPAPVTPKASQRVARTVRVASEASRAEGDEASAKRAEEDASKGEEPDRVLGPDEKALLAILAQDPPDLEALEKFVQEHPEHVLGRAMLALFLLEDSEVSAAAREHVNALRELVPDMGLPDFLLAVIESREGNLAAAVELLSQAGQKDLAWFPDFELLRLRLSEGLREGTPRLDLMRDCFSAQLPFCKVARDGVRELIAGEGDEQYLRAALMDPETRCQSARSILQLARAMQEQGGMLITNLVGAAMMRGCCNELERMGRLTDEERLLRDRAGDLRNVASLVGNRLDQILFGDQEIFEQFVRDFAARGEAHAGRRAMLEHLRRQLSR